MSSALSPATTPPTYPPGKSTTTSPPPITPPSSPLPPSPPRSSPSPPSVPPPSPTTRPTPPGSSPPPPDPSPPAPPPPPRSTPGGPPSPGSRPPSHPQNLHSLSPPSSSSDVIPTGLVVGLAIVGVSLLVIIVSLICLARKKKRRRRDYEADYYTPPPPPSAGAPNGGQQQQPPSDHVVASLPPPPKPPSQPSPPPPPPFISSRGSSKYLDLPIHPPPSRSLGLDFFKSTFTYEELAIATNGFSESNLLGQSRLGSVHKGVADFGLTKIASDTNTHVSTRVMGTYGCLAHEYADKSDVFSFGVVLLELITGRRLVDANNDYVDWARPLLNRASEQGEFEGLADTKMNNEVNDEQIVRVLEGNVSLSDLNQGIRPGHSTVCSSYGGSTDYDSSQHNDGMKKLRKALETQEYNTTGEYSNPSSDYGLYPSCSSSEGEMEMGEIKRTGQRNSRPSHKP
ncbi:hypothetical protein Bca52824_014575 [Brassica carinata]|uniref:non-specific serine/threonine protein kinase n=1 Tax=Brassica carinata TaxID=52824 RepID=A0A8X7W1T1_BRACI|nr:hypothetical protein Bca52824_014575 [Brassica carinata]